LIDVVEPFFRVLVELGYDRSIPPWEPTPARLIPPLDPAKVITDLINAIGEGINNAAALVGLPSLSVPGPVTLAAPVTEPATADMSPQVTSTSTPTQPQKTAGDENGDRTPKVTSTEPVADNDQKSTDTDTSTKHVAEPAKPDAASTDPTAASAPDPSARNDESEPAKPKARHTAPRPVVRDSLRADEWQPGLPPHGNGAGKADSSSAAASSADSPSTESKSSDDSAGGDASVS
jgi:hypothetical protein